MSLYFDCSGLPIAQGSKRVVPAGRRHIAIESNDAALRPWRNDLAVAATKVMNGRELLLGPVEVQAIFYFPRPQSHHRSDRFDRPLKVTAPSWRIQMPDLDKLQRALGDALSGVVLRDDSQIVRWEAEKRWGEKPGVEVRVRQLAELED
jgi:crossover junction endodeoxyribonuclease RusA